MIKQPIDITKEMKFYTSWLFPVGAIIFSFIFGFGSVIFLLTYNYNSLHLNLVIYVSVLLFCLGGFIWGVYTSFNSLLLTVNKEGMSTPLTGNIPWSNIKGIYVGRTNIENGYLLSLKIFLPESTSYDLDTLSFSIDPYDLLEILKTYHRKLSSKKREGFTLPKQH